MSVSMRKHIMRGCSTDEERQACKAALAAHVEHYGNHSPESVRTIYSVAVDGKKLSIEVVNRPKSYVATRMNKARRLRSVMH